VLLHCEQKSKKVKEYPAIKQVMAAIEPEYGSPLADFVVCALAGFIIHLRYGFLITPTALPRMRKSPFVTTMGS